MTKNECLYYALRYESLARDWDKIANDMARLSAYTAEHASDARAIARTMRNKAEKYRSAAERRFRRWFL